MDSSGVCECANGNQCVWTNYGNQRVNCPCYDGTPTSLEQPPSYPTDYCLTVFDKQKCGYETTCNPLINTVTCRCPDGSTCIWNDGISLNCPCQGTYSNIDDYRTERDTECQSKITLFNCPADGVIHCQSGVGTCKCTDGTLCAWGATYSVNCPCAS